ncbi:PREDICTED: galectin-3-binding protein [Gekko japonicus]|uniref:Galectin-3-binding protein n=1 Tax=Gekko japonicus TaxID=146911 RepID=A0ABM1KFJ6_GEKJA|nr:PREDICTED: galectin-3-binding protein [Gekko japonicus]
MLSLLLLWPNLTDSLAIHGIDVRLVDGSSFSEGRVEIYYAGQWGTICDDNWDMADADVVCRSLGFTGATEVKTSAAFGEGSGPILLDDVNCLGTETSLTQCSSGGWFNNNCGHGEDAGVVCINRIIYNPGTFVLDHSGNFSEDFGKLYDSQQDCDINITIMTAATNLESHGHVCAHSLILHTNNEARILLERNNNSYTLLVEKECLPSMKSFLRYFYSRHIEITLDSVKCIHKLASAYGVPGLQAYCRQIFPYLLPLDPSFRRALELYEHSLSSGDSTLQQLILQYLAWNCEALSRTEAWLDLKPDNMEALLSRTDLVIESEWSLLKALDRWAQANGPGEIMIGLLRKIRFPMLVPEQLFKLHFNLTLYGHYNYALQRKILEALEFHTVPFEFFRQYKPQEFKSDAYVPRYYFASTWSTYLTHELLTQHKGSSASQSFETPEHPSFLFNTQNISWSFTYQDIAQGCQNDTFCSSDTFLILHLAPTGSQDDTIWYENKALMVCQDSYIINILDFKNGTAVVPKTNMFDFPCPTGYAGVMALVRPGYKLNA